VLDGQKEFVAGTDDLSRLADAYGTASPLAPLRADQMVASAADRGWHLGDRVSVQLTRGEAKTYTIAAVYADDSLPADFLLPAVIGGVAAVAPAIRAARLNVLAAIAHD